MSAPRARPVAVEQAWLAPPILGLVSDMQPWASLTLPGLPPAVNNLYATDWRTRMRVLSSEARAWQGAMAAELAYRVRLPRLPDTHTRLGLAFLFCGLDHRHDTDGQVKALQDVLATHLHVNDAYVEWFLAARRPQGADAEPHTHVTIYVLDPAVRAQLARDGVTR